LEGRSVRGSAHPLIVTKRVQVVNEADSSKVSPRLRKIVITRAACPPLEGRVI